MLMKAPPSQQPLDISACFWMIQEWKCFQVGPSFVFETLPVRCVRFATEMRSMTLSAPRCAVLNWKWLRSAVVCSNGGWMQLNMESSQRRCLILFCFIRSQRHKFDYRWSYKSSPRSRWYAVKRSTTRWKTAFVNAIAALRSNRSANWSVDWNATKLRPASALQTFRWKPEMTVWCISVQARDWIRALGQFVAMIFFTAQRCLAEGKKRSESEMWWRYNGVLHRSAQNYWPLCRFLLSPTHPPQHPHSSAVHQARLSGSWIVNGRVVRLLSCFADSVPLSFDEKCEAWPPVLALINQCRQMSSTQKRWCHIKLLASKLASLTIFFLSAISLLIVPSVLFRISFALYNAEIERNPELKVIWISLYKLNCFSPSCWFLSTNDESYFFPPVRHIPLNFNAIRRWLFFQTHDFSDPICCWNIDNVFKLDIGQYWFSLAASLTIQMQSDVYHRWQHWV